MMLGCVDRTVEWSVQDQVPHLTIPDNVGMHRSHSGVERLDSDATISFWFQTMGCADPIVKCLASGPRSSDSRWCWHGHHSGVLVQVPHLLICFWLLHTMGCQVLRSCPNLETQNDAQTTGFDLAHTHMLGAFKEWASKWAISLCVSVFYLYFSAF